VVNIPFERLIECCTYDVNLSKVFFGLYEKIQVILKKVKNYELNRLADERHQKKNKAIKLTDSVKNYISEKLKEYWSPEQIMGRLELDKRVVNIPFDRLIECCTYDANLRTWKLVKNILSPQRIPVYCQPCKSLLKNSMISIMKYRFTLKFVIFLR
jgi:abortive infection bacteriophage resistance protein